MLFIRSLLFNLAWYANLIIQMLGQIPFYFFLNHKNTIDVAKRWCRSNHPFHRWLAGTDIEVTGLDNIPEGGFIVAAKHQSIWEFYALFPLFRDPCFVLKSELMKIPLFGWYVAHMAQIPIRRGDRGKAMRHMIKVSLDKIAENRQILIFPEGTRRAPGAEPQYRYGVTRMYSELNCPVLPVSLNSGLYWPRRSFLRHPGTIRIMIHEPIMPGMDADSFTEELQDRIETGCDELYRLASLDDLAPPINDAVRARIAVAEDRLRKAGN